MVSLAFSVAGSVASASMNTSMSSLIYGVSNLTANTIGKALDNRLFGSKQISEGTRLTDLQVQTSNHGDMIPLIYGTMRVAGNIIWSLPIQEVAHAQTSGGKGGRPKVIRKNYNYFVTMAIGLCEGEIDEVLRVWANGSLVQLDNNTYRIYKGTNEQMPDSLIEAVEGVGSTPAFRGLAYVVIENFPLADFANRVPNFTFEVRKNTNKRLEEKRVEDLITGVVMIPGSGEFVYEPEIRYKEYGNENQGVWIPKGTQEPINHHNHTSEADCILALKQLQSTCKNVSWIALVVNWFGTSMNLSECQIKAGVEYDQGAVVVPESWVVDGKTRSQAYSIRKDKHGNPFYGGTPCDGGVLRYIDSIKESGISVVLYPIFLMDVEGKPWRGHLSGTIAEIKEFFNKSDGYNQFILHYANLVKEKIDAFIIGSELKGLTSVQDGNGNFPAVDELIKLARQVKEILGTDVIVTYAADWSEYHHTNGGWYHLDALWASPDIDVIGIDAYFPLTEGLGAGHSVEEVISGWEAGEGIDFYYSDELRSKKTAFSSPDYAWKNIRWWWENTHVNPDGSQTDWTPSMKPIWFTEYGFPSVDAATNQPNVFYDSMSDDSKFPYFSNGNVDFAAQKIGIQGTELYWQGSDMVLQKLVWCWDARPFPYWPDRQDIWSDSPVWKTGHWLEGKLGVPSLASIVTDICVRAGFLEENIDSSELIDHVNGIAFNSQVSAREILEYLQLVYGFDVIEREKGIIFKQRILQHIEPIELK